MSGRRAVEGLRKLVAMLCVACMMSSGLWAQEVAPASTQASSSTTQAAATSSQAQGTPGAPLAAPLAAQTKPNSALTLWKPYAPHTLPQPVLRNSDRLHGLIRDDKLYLSLNDAVALLLENNFDIAIARYNLDIADTDILLAKSGSTVRGVNTGLLSGTPGGNASTATTGTTGSGTGGTSTGAGGSASGSGGVVYSTQNSVGSAIDSYDPVISGTLSGDRDTYLITQPVFYGGLTHLNINTNQYNATLAQGWSTGTLAQLSYNNQRQTYQPAASLATGPTGILAYNPLLSGSWKLTVRQHLLQGFGVSNNRREIIIAQNDRKVTNASFRAQVISTVAQINNIYWDLVNAYEDVKVQQTAVEFARRTLSDNQKQVEIGTLAPIEVVSAKSSVAAAEQKLIVSKTTLEYDQLITKNAIARNFDDPQLTTAQIIPTDSMKLSDEPLPPAEELVSYALAHRPELEVSELNLRNNEINNKAARNGLLPTLDLVGYYSGSGEAGNYGDVFSQFTNRTAPDKGVYVNLNIPLRNRAAQANQIRSQLEYRQSQLNLQQQKNQINLQVRNAAFALQQARAGVEAARAARDYARQNLDAEQKKFALGASTSYLVLQTVRDSTQAASNYISALSTYEKAQVALQQYTATILDRNGISLEDAAFGQVSHMPAVPGLQPNPTPEAVSANPVGK